MNGKIGFFTAALGCALLLGTAACGDDTGGAGGSSGGAGGGSSTTGDTTTGSQTCDSSHTCLNGACECTTEGKNGNPCTDETACESECQVCS